jgi:hypothetical protein
VVSALRSGSAFAPHAQASAAASDRTPTERIFDHWVFMLHKNARRTALGPTRRRSIERMLALYDEETLLLAVEGCAASAWHAGENDRGRAFDDLELILRDEAHVERFAELGQRLRDRVREREATARTVAPIVEPDADAIAEQRARLREAAARISGRRHGG